MTHMFQFTPNKIIFKTKENNIDISKYFRNEGN